MASTLGHFVIPQRVFLAELPSINKKCHQNHFLGVLEITGCRLHDIQYHIALVTYISHILVDRRRPAFALSVIYYAGKMLDEAYQLFAS